MALLKPIKQNNGIILTYHRIYNIENIVNDSIKITVYSYPDEEERNKEKEMIESGKILYKIYIQDSKETYPYETAPTIQEAYEYLKTTDKYKGATDV